MDHLVANQWPVMSSSSEMVLEKWAGLILASIATESMSTPRKFVVVAGFVTSSELTVKPSSLHIAIMVAMLLVQTRECGVPTVK